MSLLKTKAKLKLQMCTTLQSKKTLKKQTAMWTEQIMVHSFLKICKTTRSEFCFNLCKWPQTKLSYFKHSVPCTSKPNTGTSCFLEWADWHKI